MANFDPIKYCDDLGYLRSLLESDKLDFLCPGETYHHSIFILSNTHQVGCVKLWCKIFLYPDQYPTYWTFEKRLENLELFLSLLKKLLRAQLKANLEKRAIKKSSEEKSLF